MCSRIRIKLTVKLRSLADKGIRRIRREGYSTIHKVIVFAGNYFAILDVEEYSLIARSPPRFSTRIEPDEAKKNFLEKCWKINISQTENFSPIFSVFQ
ncbi:hypothetical protein J7K43_07270 [Candidatus Calescamantes bacterium]|nr:hypothetical protein [Candidatus Calescamantes bacterium]